MKRSCMHINTTTLQANTATTNHGDFGAWLNPGCMKNCSHTGCGRTSNQGSSIERHVLSYLDQRMFVDKHHLGKG